MRTDFPMFLATLAAVVSLTVLLAGTYRASIPLLIVGAFGLLTAVTAAAFITANNDK